MKFKEWRSLWRIDRDIDVPHASIVIMTPYGFVRVLWHYCRQEFKAWPSAYETGIVYGWRWPWQKQFTERKRIKSALMPMAVYWVMDEMYLARVAREFAPNPKHMPLAFTPGVGKLKPIRDIVQAQPHCPHNYWIATCENCARKALLAALTAIEEQKALGAGQ